MNIDNKHDVGVFGPPEYEYLPITALLALAMTGFLALVTETLPAGMLAQISGGLGISEAWAGQMVTLFAVGSLVAAIPLVAATRGYRRRGLLLLALTSLLVFNLVTALASNYVVILVVRLLAGMAGGLIWGMLAGYARRLVIASLKGRALAVAGIGAPLALSLGVPIGAWLGALIGWRQAFLVMSALSLLVMMVVAWKVPDYPGQPNVKRTGITRVLRHPGLRSVYGVLLFWVLAHSILYTYIVPFIAPSGLAERVDVVLFVFGVMSLLGIWVTGVLIDRMLRALVLGNLAIFALVALALGLGYEQPAVVYLGVAVWGLTFGGSAALLQTATAEAAVEDADVAQAFFVTVWNSAIAIGGLLGGYVLTQYSAQTMPWVLLVLLLLGVVMAWQAKTYGFRVASVRRGG